MQQGWAEVPREVLDNVFSLLSTADCWKARRVSTAWARQVRQTASFDVAIHANSSNLIRKVQALFRRQRLPHVVVTFRITNLVQLDSLSALLQAVINQRKYLSSFKLEVGLLIPHTSKKASLFVTQIRCIASDLLANHGVELSIKLMSANRPTMAPPPGVLQALGPFLASVDIPSLFRTAEHVAFTSVHIAALVRCSRNLSVLSIHEMDPLRQVPPAIQLATSIPEIAQLTGLTKLRLQLDNSSQLAGFQPLGQLSFLEHLMLDCKCDDASCADVLRSSGDTLRQVSLSSNSWTPDTYSALQQIPGLDWMTLCLHTPSAPQIDALAGITATTFRLILCGIQLVPEPLLLHLTTANPAVHGLWLSGIDDACCQQLGSLTSLQTLTVFNSPLLTGATFNTPPSVTKLVFINCPSVSSQTCKRILRTALPACTRSRRQAIASVVAEVGSLMCTYVIGLVCCCIAVEAGIQRLKSIRER